MHLVIIVHLWRNNRTALSKYNGNVTFSFASVIDQETRRNKVQWVPLNIIPSVHEKIMTISGIFYYPMYGSYRGYRGTIGSV